MNKALVIVSIIVIILAIVELIASSIYQLGCFVFGPLCFLPFFSVDFWQQFLTNFLLPPYEITELRAYTLHFLLATAFISMFFAILAIVWRKMGVLLLIVAIFLQALWGYYFGFGVYRSYAGSAVTRNATAIEVALRLMGSPSDSLEEAFENCEVSHIALLYPDAEVMDIYLKKGGKIEPPVNEPTFGHTSLYFNKGEVLELASLAQAKGCPVKEVKIKPLGEYFNKCEVEKVIEDPLKNNRSSQGQDDKLVFFSDGTSKSTTLYEPQLTALQSCGVPVP